MAPDLWTCLPCNGLAYLALDLPTLQWTCLPCNGLAYLAMDLHILQWTCLPSTGLAMRLWAQVSA